MPIADDIENDVNAAKKMRLPWWGVVCWMAFCACVMWPFYHADRLDLALPVVNATGVLGFVAAIKWKLRRQGWFWITMSILAALHVVLFLVVPWSDKWVPAIAIAFIDSADVVLMLKIIAAVGKALKSRRSVTNEPSDQPAPNHPRRVGNDVA